MQSKTSPTIRRDEELSSGKVTDRSHEKVMTLRDAR